jgi:hypothetical protein
MVATLPRVLIYEWAIELIDVPQSRYSGKNLWTGGGDADVAH